MDDQQGRRRARTASNEPPRSRDYPAEAPRQTPFLQAIGVGSPPDGFARWRTRALLSGQRPHCAICPGLTQSPVARRAGELDRSAADASVPGQPTPDQTRR